MDGLNFLCFVLGILVLIVVVGYALFYSIMFILATIVLFWPWLLLFGVIGLIALGKKMESRA